jgi:hypothetical protein
MTQNQSRPLFFEQQHQQQYNLPSQQYLQPPADVYDSGHYSDSFDIDFDLDSLQYNSLAASPTSTLLSSQYSPLTGFDDLTTPILSGPSLFPPPRQSGQAAPQSAAAFLANTDAMQTEGWMHNNGQLTPRSVGHFSHQRDSSRSSMGSNGPPSPFSHNFANPQIAMSDSNGDPFHGSGGADEMNVGHYQLAPKPFPGISHDGGFYSGLTSYGSTDGAGVTGYPYQSTAPIRRNDRGLLLPDHPIGPRSQPVSVASSIASDSPATPAGESEAERKRNTGETGSDPFDYLASTSRSPSPDATAIPPVPKLERTTTDAYADELYNPNFTIPSQSSAQTSISPTSDLFNQRLQAANNQHLSAVTNSPVSSTSRDRSPFRTGSPMAAMPLNDYRSAMGPQMRFGTMQQLREQNKTMQDEQAARQRIAEMTTPQTISPKDAMLEYREPEGDANFPLFPQQDSNGFDADAINKAAAAHSQQVFGGMPMDTNTFNNFLNSSMQSSVPVQQQYPFITRPQNTVHSNGNVSRATTRLGSTDTGATESAHGIPQRPADTRADGGTYTCTYHGCTMRFDTPALLQKHKREGHRQAHGLGGPRRPEAPGATSALVNTQAGPHRCDRINPSTGKPCNTVFSRPYDLTRHEHTIHNARKQKVRCDLCTDEKAFSRADALTRHYRVCHPDVEFPGKQRKRGVRTG